MRYAPRSLRMAPRAPLMALCLAACLGLSSRPLGATDVMRTNAYTLAAEDTQSADLWLMAERIVVEGTAEDDLFLCAEHAGWRKQEAEGGGIRLAGECRNDVWAFGDAIEVTGVIRDHARLMGQRIRIAGAISNNAFLLGSVKSVIQLDRDAVLAGDAWLFGDTLMAGGTVNGDLTLVGKTVTLSGYCGGDIDLTALREVVVLPGAEIMGNLTYRAPTELILSPAVKLHGRLQREPLTEPRPKLSLSYALFNLWLFGGALLVGAVGAGVFPGALERAAAVARRSPSLSLLIGMAVAGLLPPLLLAALFTLVGWPLVFLLVASLAIMVYLSKFIVAYVLGRWLLRRTAPPRRFAERWPPLFVGLAVLYLCAGVGWIGLALWLFVAVWGVGAMGLALFARPLPPALSAEAASRR